MRSAILKGLCYAMALATVVVLLVCPASAETRLSVSGGVFLPSSDYGDTWSSAGMDGTASYTMVNDETGLEFAAHGYTLADDSYDVDLTSVGLEILIHFHKTNTKFQPFFAFGFGRYKTYITTSADTQTYEAQGSILKLGVRYYFTETFFAGAYIRKFQNEFSQGTGWPDADYGGNSLCMEVGIVVF